MNSQNGKARDAAKCALISPMQRIKNTVINKSLGYEVQNQIPSQVPVNSVYFVFKVLNK